MTPETQAQIQLWRQKSRDGTLTQDEMRQAILILRQDRVGAAGVSATAKAKKQKTADNKRVNSDDLLNELDSL